MNKIILCCLSVLVSACVLGPDYKPPETIKATSYSNEHSEYAERVKLVQGEEIQTKWWQLYQSPALNKLVETGLRHSPTLAAAQAKLLSSRESLAAYTGSVLYPNVTAQLNANRQKISGAGFGNTSFGSIFTVFNTSVNVNYIINPLGKGQRFLEAKGALIDIDLLQLQAARLTIAANIVTSAIQEASLRAQLAAQKQVIASSQSLLDIAQQRYDVGAIARAELLSQRTAVAQLKTVLPSMQKSLAQIRHQLLMLTGKLPGESQLASFELTSLSLPESLPLSLPSEMARQRPDIRAAEAMMHQANAMLGVAEIQLYPQFSISAGMAGEGTRLVDLFTSNPVWNLGANMLQPIFNAGELQARKREALANLEWARANYRSILLQAFQNVADSLLALQHDEQQLQLQLEALKLAKESHDLVAEQYRHGATSQLALLDAQSQWQASQIGVAQARAMLLADTAALMQSLGGGVLNQNP